MQVLVREKHETTAILGCCQSNFTSPSDHNLVVNHGTRWAIYELKEGTLHFRSQHPINGRILVIRSLRNHQRGIDYLVCLLKQNTLLILAHQGGQPVVLFNQDTNDIACRPVENGPILVIDPLSRFIVMHSVQGLIKIIPVAWNQGKGMDPTFGHPFNLRIDELHISDIQFLARTDDPLIGKHPKKQKADYQILSDACIGILYHDAIENKAVKAYLINRDNENRPREVSSVVLNASGNDLIQRWHFSLLDPTSHLLISVPGPRHGVITVGYSFIQYYNHLSKSECTVYAETMTNFVAHAPIDPDGYRYLLSDAEGNMYLLVLEGVPNVTSMQLRKLGQTSIPSCVCYLDSGLVFIGSELGNTQLIRLEADCQVDGQFLSTLDNLINIGPILDAIHLDDTEKDTLIVCAGAFQDSSIKIINSGVAAIVTHSLDFPGHLVSGMLKHKEGIMINTPFITYSLDPDHHSIATLPTSTELFPSNHKSTIEALLGKVLLMDFVSDHYYLYANGKRMIFGDVISNTNMIREFQAEIGAVKILTNSPYTSLLTTPPTVIHGDDDSFELNSSSFVTSICSYLDMLLFGMADGTLIIRHTDASQTSIQVGTDPVKLFGLNDDIVLMCSDHVRLFRIRDSMPECPIINLPNESVMLHEPPNMAFPLTKSNFVLIRQTRIDFCTFPEDPYLHATSKSLHVQSIKVSSIMPPMDGFPFTARHLTRHSQTNTITAIINNYPGPGPISRYRACTPVSKLLSLNAKTLELVDSFAVSSIDPLDKQHRLIAQSIKSFVPSGMTDEFIVVGAVLTEVMTKPDDAPSQGFLSRESVVAEEIQMGAAHTATFKPLIRRKPVVIKGHPESGAIMIFGMLDTKMTLLTMTKIDGCPYDIELMKDFIIVAVNASVSVFKWSTAGVKNGKLSLVYTQRMQTATLNLNACEHHLVVGDLMRSVSLWKLSPLTNRLELQSKDNAYHWITSSVVDEKGSVLVSDNSSNLLSFTPIDDKLKRVAVWHLGEPLNKIIKSKENNFIYLTATGSIGVIIPISAHEYTILKTLERRIQLPTFASLSHIKWHSFKDDRQIITVEGDDNGVIDGQALSAFSHLDEGMKSKLVEGVRDEHGALMTTKSMHNLVGKLLKF